MNSVPLAIAGLGRFFIQREVNMKADQRSTQYPRHFLFLSPFIFFIIITFLGSVALPAQTSLAADDSPQGPQGNRRIWMPIVTKAQPQAYTSSEWSQEAHDAQRTGYTPEEPSEPWTLAWTWNGPDSNGGTGNHFYDAPRDAHTITGGSNVYVPAGDHGLYALSKANGSVSWHLTDTSFNATPAYDENTGYVYAPGYNGSLYKINGTTGKVAGVYDAGSRLNKAVLLVNSFAYVIADDGRLHKVDTNSMSKNWVYTANSGVTTPAAYSASHQLIIYATADLNVHAVRVGDGSLQWKVKPTSHPAQSPYTFAGYWPVVADQHGIVFLRMNLGMDALWSGPNKGDWGGGVYPTSNAATRQLLQANNGNWQNLFALNLDNGSQAFIPAVGFGGVEDLNGSQPVLDTGPVPVIRKYNNGPEVAYTSFRSGQDNPHDGRWDSHMGEMVLDSSTISGLAAGDLRFIDFKSSTIGISDEQTPFTMAGNTIFHAHWGASEAVRITDRSSGKGMSHESPIPSASRPTVIRRMGSCNNFNPGTHWTTCGLGLFGDTRYWDGPGFWVYWNVYDPPTPGRSAYSEGISPRYTYAGGGLVVVEGNGGELLVLTHK